MNRKKFVDIDLANEKIQEQREELYELKQRLINFKKWFRHNFNLDYGTDKSKSGFFVDTNAYDIIKEFNKDEMFK